MIYQWTCNRLSLVDYIVNRKPVNELDLKISNSLCDLYIGNDEFVMIWDRNPSVEFSIPQVVVINENSTIDFLAWVTTYFRQIRPFTSQCRVLSPTYAKMLLQKDHETINTNVNTAIIGLILAEGVAYSVGRTDLNRLPFSAFARTLCFSLAKGSQNYIHTFADMGLILEEIRNGWATARELVNQPSLILSSSEIREVFEIVNGVVDKDTFQHPKVKYDLVLVEAIKGLKESGRIPNAVLAKISESSQAGISIFREMDGPRETRVKAVEGIIRELVIGPIETKRRRAFLAGYIVSLVQPGSLDHFPLLSSAITDLPECFLWYGACAGLIQESSVDNYANGLGWLLRRELERTSFCLDRPRCDIALSEMIVLLKNREEINLNIRTLTSGTLEVEIFPLVSTTMKYSEHVEVITGEKNTIISNQKTLFGDESQLRQDVLEILYKIEEGTKSLYAIRKQVEMKFGEKTTKGKWKK